MSDTRKFVLSYDAEYDHELHQLIEDTPRKRRSERIRHLILLGLAHERQGEPPAPSLLAPLSDASRESRSDAPVVESPRDLSEEERRDNQPQWRETRQRKHVQFTPPNQN